MKLSLKQLVQREEGPRWVNWTPMMSEREFIEAMRYFMKSMIPDWYREKFIIVSIEENEMRTYIPEIWLRDHGLIQEETT